jgi:hypothetical protein
MSKHTIDDAAIQRIAQHVASVIVDVGPTRFNAIERIANVVAEAIREEITPTFRYTVDVKAVNEHAASEHIIALAGNRRGVRIHFGDPGSHRIKDEDR